MKAPKIASAAMGLWGVCFSVSSCGLNLGLFHLLVGSMKWGKAERCSHSQRAKACVDMLT